MRGRRSSRRGSSRKARKSYWTGAVFAGQNVTLTNAVQPGEVATMWVKWPSGTTSFLTGEVDSGQFVVPNDETLVRTIMSSNMTLDLQGVIQSSYPVCVTVGLLTWESRTPADIDLVVNPPGLIPNPALDVGADWIIRQPFTFTRDNFSEGTIAELFITSRAMRKLPPLTGVLACVGIAAPIFSSEDQNLKIDWSVDVRQLMKSGYYSA